MASSLPKDPRTVAKVKIMAAVDWAQTIQGGVDIMQHPDCLNYFGCLNRDEFNQAIDEFERRLEAYKADTEAMIVMHGKGR